MRYALTVFVTILAISSAHADLASDYQQQSGVDILSNIPGCTANYTTCLHALTACSNGSSLQVAASSIAEIQVVWQQEAYIKWTSGRISHYETGTLGTGRYCD
jgi:hypothetical protein